MIRVGIVGAGGIARHLHIPRYKKISDVEVVAIADSDKDRAEILAQEFNIPKIYCNYEEMFEKENLTAISVCTPNYLHAPVTISALNRGIHVLCEKPMATSVKEAEDMVEASKKSGKILMIGQTQRFRPFNSALKRIIEKGELGEIYYARGSLLRRKGIPGIGTWFTTKEMAGGGCLLDIGVHILDIVWWLMGMPKPKFILGNTYANFGPKGLGEGGWNKGAKGKPIFDVEDFAVGFIKFENGATLTIETSWASNIEKDEGNYLILGTLGGAQLNPPKIFKDLENMSSNIEIIEKSTEWGEGEIDHFVECVKENKEPIVTGEQGLTVMKMLMGIYESSEKGIPIEI
ncbi:MAG: Gfo/Idh/MocA family oxidoreductase [Dictyoglomus sp.]|nr:Gfo/Idh/MocA family oxidoreductase [Dictyoglomus sp.]MDW8189011.1 Gfo/Idh/MocA family oxidoreductase [Dictyoglomus sp.]